MAHKRGGNAIFRNFYGLGFNVDCGVLKQPRMLTRHYYKRMTGVMLGEDANDDLKAMGWRRPMDAEVFKFDEYYVR
jgi:hypothetical protein